MPAKKTPAARTITVPSDLATQFAAPEDATIDELATLAEQAQAEANALVADDAATKYPDLSFADRMARAEWYIGAMDTIEGRQGEIKAAQQAEADQIAAVRERLNPKSTEDGAAAEGAEGAQAEKTPEEIAEDEAKAKSAEGAVVESGTATDPATQGAEGGVLVAGAQSGRRSAVAAAASAGRSGSGSSVPLPPRRTTQPSAYLTAGAGIGGVEAGAKVDYDEMGRIAVNRFGSLPSFDGAPATRHSLGRVVVPMSDERLVASGGGGEFVDPSEAIEWALSNERLKAETGEDSLVAAGGWCAPSEVLYDLVNLTTRDGLLDVPGIGVNRGGVKFSLGPDFTAVYNAGANFTKTEAQAIAGSVKPVVNIPCPSFTDNRMLVDGLYLTGDILSQKGYPEAYADFIEKAMTAWIHYVNAASIADMAAASTLVDFTAIGVKGTLAVTTELLGSIELVATDIRYKNRLGIDGALELVLPLWLKGALRSDLAKRLGVENGAGITDAQIATYFAARNVNVQWVYDWQDAFTGVAGGFGGATPPTAWPITAQYLLYPQGTFVRALGEVIDLQAVYDSTLLTTNQFVALFMEQGRLTLKRAWDSRVVKIPVVVSGATAMGVDYTLAANQPTV